MTDTAAPDPADVAALDAAAQEYAESSGQPFDVAKEQLVNLLVNMEKDPTGTALYFARAELAARAAVAEIARDVANLADRVAYLEDIGGNGPT